MVDEQSHDESRQRLACLFRQLLPLRRCRCLPPVWGREQIELICHGLAWHGHLPDSFRERPMLRPSPRIVMRRQLLPAILPKYAGWRVRRADRQAAPVSPHGSVEHPRRDFNEPIRRSARKAATENSRPFGQRLMDVDELTRPGMPRIQKLANLCPVGVRSSCCSIDANPPSFRAHPQGSGTSTGSGIPPGSGR